MKLEQMTFEQIYLDYYNNFLTLEKMAKHYQVNEELLKNWIECGKKQNHSEAWEELSNQINDFYFNLI